ncbi:MAG: endonuclease/exonuclease/phosphatase family protein [Actinomycetes bacterium]
MSYNIFMGGRRGAALHEVIRESAPDVLLLNESPKFPVIWKRQCKDLSERWGMRFVAGGRKAGSNMIAVRGAVRVKSVTAHSLPQPLFKPRRGIVSAQLRVDGKMFGVVVCHLSLTREGRATEVEHVIAAANALRGPVVVAGDLNEDAGGPSWRRLRQVGFADHGTRHWRTFPSESPETRIDALLVRGSMTVERHGDPGVCEELQVAASDHRPILAVVDL